MNQEEYPDFVDCPLVDHDIDAGDCLENRDIVDGNINVDLPPKYTVKAKYKTICRECKWHDVY